MKDVKDTSAPRIRITATSHSDGSSTSRNRNSKIRREYQYQHSYQCIRLPSRAQHLVFALWFFGCSFFFFFGGQPSSLNFFYWINNICNSIGENEIFSHCVCVCVCYCHLSFVIWVSLFKSTQIRYDSDDGSSILRPNKPNSKAKQHSQHQWKMEKNIAQKVEQSDNNTKIHIYKSEHVLPMTKKKYYSFYHIRSGRGMETECVFFIFFFLYLYHHPDIWMRK